MELGRLPGDQLQIFTVCLHDELRSSSIFEEYFPGRDAYHSFRRGIIHGSPVEDPGAPGVGLRGEGEKMSRFGVSAPGAPFLLILAVPPAAETPPRGGGRVFTPAGQVNPA